MTPLLVAMGIPMTGTTEVLALGKLLFELSVTRSFNALSHCKEQELDMFGLDRVHFFLPDQRPDGELMRKLWRVSKGKVIKSKPLKVIVPFLRVLVFD